MLSEESMEKVTIYDSTPEKKNTRYPHRVDGYPVGDDRSSGMDTHTQRYLQHYGYLPRENNNHQNLMLSPRAALLDLQHMAGLNTTGELDKDTFDLTHKPRCGNRDIVDEGNLGFTHDGRRAPKLAFGDRERVRIKRYGIQGSKWRKRHLTFRISRYSTKLSRQFVESTIEAAFQSWSDVTPLTFTPTRCRQPDIDISFATRYHGDRSPFDGPGGVLAHAFFPGRNDDSINGDAHFDDDETWVKMSRAKYGTPLLGVAIHEIGHSLGLLHSRDPNAAMWAWFSGTVSLTRDDVIGIQALYGAAGTRYGSTSSRPPPNHCIPEGRKTISSRDYPYIATSHTRTTIQISPASTRSTHKPMTTARTQSPGTMSTTRNRMTSRTTQTVIRKPATKRPTSPLCSGYIDAFLLTNSRNMFIFAGSLVFTYPSLVHRLVGDVFPGAPGSVDASFSLTIGWGLQKVFLIKGTWCWRFTTTSSLFFTPDYGYPRTLYQEFGTYIRRVDAAYTSQWRRTVTLISGYLQWTSSFDWDRFHNIGRDTFSYNHALFRLYPISAAFRWKDGRLYLFVGDEFYVYESSRITGFLPQLTGPRNTAGLWFRCKPT